MRWAQQYLLHRELVVQVHAVYPSDRDVAFNTQLETFEHLANVRGSTSVVSRDAGIKDVGVTLVTKGLAWVRRVADAGVPRASNLLDVFRAINNNAAAAVATTGVLLSCPDVEDQHAEWSPEVNTVACARLGKAQRLPAPAAADLLRFHDARWRRQTWAAFQKHRAGQLRDSAHPARAGATAEVWNKYIWCADLHHDPSDEPRVYIHRPLRTLFPLAGLAEWRVQLQGQVDGAVVLKTRDGRRFLQVEVTSTTSAAEWRELRQSYGYADLDVVRFSPTPGDAVLGKKVKVVVTASSFGQDVETRLRVCCSSYSTNTFLLAQHSPSGEWPVKEGGRCEEELSITGTAKEERAFVLDVVVEARDENSMTWTQRGTRRAVYLLSPDAASDAMEASGNDDEAKNAAGAEAETLKDTSTLQPLQFYQLSMSVFFELHPGVGEIEKDAEDTVATGGSPLLSTMKRTFADLMYEDVVVLPVGVAEVCGVRGLVGDLLFPRESVPRAADGAAAASLLRERAPLSFTRSLLSCVGQHWWPCEDLRSGAPSWPMSTVVRDAVQESFNMCLEKVAEGEWAARQVFGKEVAWNYQLMEQEALKTFLYYRLQTPFKTDEVPPPTQSAPKRCLHFTADHVDLWRDSEAADTLRPRLCLPASILPPTVPLTLFAVRPRELFFCGILAENENDDAAQRRTTTQDTAGEVL
jgi:hypothetical protein